MFVPLFFHWYVNPVPVFAFKLTEFPWQNVVAPPAVIVAEGNELTVTVIVVLIAHVGDAVDVGVNVYVVVAVLFNAGDQVPEILLFDVVGNAFIVPPEQIWDTWVNVGVVEGFTVIVIVVVVAHCPDAGVNVYVVVELLFKAGAQEPVKPLVDVVGRGESDVPEHIAFIWLKVGEVAVFTTIVWFVFTTPPG
jgi:hypothetical protein